MKRLKTTGTTHAYKAPTLILKILVVLWSIMNVQVAQAISVEEIERYSSPIPYGKARLSPDGKFLAVAADREGRDVVVILKTDSLEANHVVQFTGESEQVGDFQWVSNERLVVTVQRFQKSEMERPFSGGELFSVNADGKKGKKYSAIDCRQIPAKRRTLGLVSVGSPL
jgi:hypothetical protein